MEKRKKWWGCGEQCHVTGTEQETSSVPRGCDEQSVPLFYRISAQVERNKAQRFLWLEVIPYLCPQFEQFAGYERMGWFIITTEMPNSWCRYFRNVNRTDGMGRLNISQWEKRCTAPYLKAFLFCLLGRRSETALLSKPPRDDFKKERLFSSFEQEPAGLNIEAQQQAHCVLFRLSS